MNTILLSNQMLCAVGENLASAHLISHGWPTSNVNRSIDNFKGIDLFCQKGLDSTDIVGIQVKTTTKESFLVGMTTEDTINLDILKKRIIGPWIFVHIKSLVPIEADYYVLPRHAVIDILYQAHDWYLNKWNRPASPSLLKSPAAMQLSWLRGENQSSRNSPVEFINPYPGDIFRKPASWDNIW